MNKKYISISLDPQTDIQEALIKLNTYLTPLFFRRRLKITLTYIEHIASCLFNLARVFPLYFQIIYCTLEYLFQCLIPKFTIGFYNLAQPENLLITLNPTSKLYKLVKPASQ